MAVFIGKRGPRNCLVRGWMPMEKVIYAGAEGFDDLFEIDVQFKAPKNYLKRRLFDSIKKEFIFLRHIKHLICNYPRSLSVLAGVIPLCLFRYRPAYDEPHFSRIFIK